MSKPTCRELLMDIRVERGKPAENVCAGLELAARVELVLALHADRHGWCIECSRTAGEMIPWPCPTVRRLDGED